MRITFQLDFINVILNVAALLLWLSWRWLRLDPLVRGAPASLAGTLKRAEPSRLRGWHLLACMAALLLARAGIYWWVGSAGHWTATVRLGVIRIPFRSDVPGLMLLFSLLSFCLTLGMFYLSLLLLSLVNARVSEIEPVRKLVRLHLGRVDRWPWLVKGLLPLILSVFLWFPGSLLFARLGLIPIPRSGLHRLEQGLVLGLSSYLLWKYIIIAILGLYLLASYVYFGSHGFWTFVSVSGGNLLAPLRPIPLQIGKVDFAPLLVIGLVFLAAFYAEHGLVTLFARLQAR